MDSSFPPSIAFKAAQLQGQQKSIWFIHEMREMMFLEKKNLAKWENMAKAAEKVDLDVSKLKSHFNAKAKDLFSIRFKVRSGIRR